MKFFFLSLIFLLFTSSVLKAQCLDERSDTTYLFCGGSVELNTGLSAISLLSLSTHSLNQIHFADPMSGCIAGDHGTILRTTDGGISWNSIEYLPEQDWKTVCFASQQLGVIASKTGVVAKTMNGGESWEVIYEDATKVFTRITCLDALTYLAVGEMGLILKTSDGGASWNIIPSGTTALLNDIEFVSNTVGFIAADRAWGPMINVFLKTTDGGDSWINSFVSADYGDYKRVRFKSELTGYMTGPSYTYKTLDGGVNWISIPWLGDVSFALLNDSTGYCASVDDIREFSQYGAASQYVHFYFPDEIMDIACPDSSKLFAIGRSGFLGSLFAPVSYHWEPSTGLSADDVANPIASPLEPMQYIATVQYSGGQTCTDTLQVLILKGWYSPHPCMVTVDPASPHFRILWDQPELSTADSVYLFKEGNISGQPIRLAGFSASAPGEYLDEQSNPAVKTEWYSLQVVDICANAYTGYNHSPVHLAINQGTGSTWNLIWTGYQGVPVITYNIYRGTTTGDLQLLTSVSASITQYSDLYAPAGDITYQIEAVLDADCNSSKKSIASYSNIARYSPNGNPDAEPGSGFLISNNPIDQHFSIRGNRLAEIHSVQLISLQGEPIKTWEQPGAFTFDVSGLPAGMYILQLELKDQQQGVLFKLIKR